MPANDILDPPEEFVGEEPVGGERIVLVTRKTSKTATAAAAAVTLLACVGVFISTPTITILLPGTDQRTYWDVLRGEQKPPPSIYIDSSAKMLNTAYTALGVIVVIASNYITGKLIG